MMQNRNYPYYEVAKISNLRELIEEHLSERPQNIAFSYRKCNEMVKKTYQEFYTEIEELGEFFLQNYKKAHIGITGENSYGWLVAYFAITCSGNVAVPIDVALPATEISGLLEQSDCVALVYSETYCDVVDEIRKSRCRLRGIYSINDLVKYQIKGRKKIVEGKGCFRDVVIDAEDTAAIVFTSGTMGVSKGVVLTHGNLCADIYASCRSYMMTGGVVAFLPFHHIFGMVASIMVIFHHGQPIHINHSLKFIIKDIQECRPQTLLLVPLYIESFYKQIMNGIREKKRERQFEIASRIIPIFDKLGIDLRRKFFAEILQMFGGKLEYIICGGAALDSFYIKQFRMFGIELRNGYGITECSAVISVNRNQYNRDGSVGQVIPCCEVKIADNGEILVRGSNVMNGYYKDEQSTMSAFSDGWYHTGDIGYMDEEGFLYINGRSKNLIILSNGENISPERIEQELSLSPMIGEIIVSAKENYLVAEIYPSQEYPFGNQEKEIGDELEQWNRKQPSYRQIKEFTIRKEEFEKTTTRKIKR